MSTKSGAIHWASEGVGATAAALVDLSTVAGIKISNPPWVKFQSAGWVNFPSAPTAYGHKYCNDTGIPTLVLIYPCWSGLRKALPVFDYGEGMKLWVLPFELDGEGCLVDAEAAGLALCSDRVSRNPLWLSA